MSKFGNNGLQRLKARTKGPAKSTENMGVGATDSKIKDVQNSKGEIRPISDLGITPESTRLGGSIPVGGAGVKGFVKGLVKLGAKAIKKYKESK